MKNSMIICLGVVAAVVSCRAGDAADVDNKGAQVYDVKISIKTTEAKAAKLSAKKNPFLDADGAVVYRKQASKTWVGLIWGCDCESIRGKWCKSDAGAVSGCIIWDKKTSDILFSEDINWRLINAIDTTGTKCEGCWTIGNTADTSKAFLAFSGFGTLVLQKFEDGLSCRSYVKSISGNVAGWMPAPTKYTEGRKPVCTFCSVIDPGEEGSEEMADAWDFCKCAEIGDRDFTAVSGTWSIKYNKSDSAKLSENASILDFYKKFPANVRLKVAEKEASLIEGKQ